LAPNQTEVGASTILIPPLPPRAPPANPYATFREPKHFRTGPAWNQFSAFRPPIRPRNAAHPDAVAKVPPHPLPRKILRRRVQENGEVQEKIVQRLHALGEVLLKGGFLLGDS